MLNQIHNHLLNRNSLLKQIAATRKLDVTLLQILDEQLIVSGNQGITSYHYFYDNTGNLNKVEYYKVIQGVKKQLPGRIVEISYTANGLPKEWIEYNPENPSAKEIALKDEAVIDREIDEEKKTL